MKKYASDYSAFESAYWQMLMARESACSSTNPDHSFERYEVECLFRTWNEQFDDNKHPRWALPQ